MPHVNEGSCQCGAVRFEIGAPYRWFAHCHCSMCRKQSGALFGTSVGVADRGFRWLAGSDEIEPYRASPAFERPFCRSCGAKVPARSHEPDSWTVPAGLVRGELAGGPRTHIFVAAKSSLAAIADGLPQHALYPPGIDLPIVATPPSSRTGVGLAGSCLCGMVAFETSEMPNELVHCHCAQCRTSSGAAFASTLAVPTTAFRWLRGERATRAYAGGAPHVDRRAFCSGCGSATARLGDDSSAMLLPAGAVDTRLAPLPAVHLHVDAKAHWDEITDTWPRFAADRR